jgi:hypothetical protein
MTDSILRRAARAATRRFRLLGVLFDDGFREADIVLHEGYYYALNTEMAAGGAPGTTWNIQSTQVDNPADGYTLVTLTTAHGLIVGTRQYVLAFSGTGVPGLSGAKFCTAPTATTLAVIQNTTVAGSAGTVSYSVSIPFVGLRRATTPEGIAQASGSDYVSRVANSIYYPSLVVEGSGANAVWHLFGYNTTGAGTRHATYTGTYPSSIAAFATGADINVKLGDICVRKHPSNGYWYAVGNTDDDGRVTALYRNDNLSDNDGWEVVAADIWAGGAPAWVEGAYHPDPTLCFLDGDLYLLFTSGQVSGEWNTGITTLDVTTGAASSANIVTLQEYGDYHAWQGGHVLSDLTLLRCHDGMDRIFGFVNPGSFYFDGEGPWACMELRDGPAGLMWRASRGAGGRPGRVG